MSNEDGLLNIPAGEGDGNKQTPPPAEPPKGDGNGTPEDKAPDGAKDTFASNWKDFIPEELKDRSEWSNIKDVSDLYKNYINAQQMISKSVRIPDAASSPEEVLNFYKKLGKPDSKDGYDFEYKPAKKEYVYNKDSFDFGMFKDIADKANLTADQYQALASAYIDINNENYLNYNQGLAAKAAEELKASENKLKMTWGEKYNQNINLISEKIKGMYDASTLKRMQDAGLFRDTSFLETHLKLTKMMTGDTVFIEGNAVENVPQTLQTLRDKRDKLMSEDYDKHKDQVLALNQQIVKLRQSQQNGATKFVG